MHKWLDIHTNAEKFERETISFTADVLIKGTIVEKISENNKGARYVLRDMTIGTQKFPSNVGVLITFPDGRNRNIDDIISFTGKLKQPISNDIFDYKTYLLLDNIFAITSTSFPEKIGMAHSSDIIFFIRNVRTKFLSLIENIYPGESAKLLQGMLIGERANISLETKKNFNNSGLTHIVAVSGFNITIILLFLSFLFKSFPVWIRMFLALFCVGFFTLLVGSQISVLRASIVGLVAYIILLSGGQIRAFSVLLMVAVIFVVINPLILNYDISFQLSFLAVLGLLFFGDYFSRLFSFVPKWFGIRETLAMCFSAMILTLPIIIINFNQFSIISPVANLLVTPLIPLIMLLGFASIIASLFSLSLGILIGFPTWIGLSYILQIITFLGSFQYAIIPTELGILAHIFEIGYFMVIIFLILYFQTNKT